MARINRSDVIQKAVNDLAISISSDKVPTETLDKVQLVYGLNKHFSTFVAQAASTATGTLTMTMPTIDSRSEIYITSADFDMIKDATCDQATAAIGAACTPFEQGISKTFLQISTITLTAQNGRAHIDFAYPLKLKPNTNITANGTFTVGAMVRSLNCTGFIVSTN